MNNVLEIIMIIATFVYSYLIMYCKRSSFIFGVIASGILAWTLFVNKVYVQAILNLIYMITYLYSFFSWKIKEDRIKITNITRDQVILIAESILIFTIGIGYFFSRMETAYPYIDAFSTGCSIVGIILLSNKKIQNSHLLVLSNIASIYICYMTQDYLAIISFVIYMIFNILIIFTWNSMKIKNKV